MERKMMTRRTMAKATLATILLAAFGMSGCGEKTIIGTWSNEDGDEILQFDEDGSCSLPFTYSKAWLESCDRYVVKDDGSLVVSSSQGNIRSKTWEKTDDRDEAMDGGMLYYLNGDELILNHDVYTRSN